MADVNDEPLAGTATTSTGDDGRPVVTLTGEFDISNIGELRAALDAIDDAPEGLRLEAGELRFIDSSGIAALLQCAERLGPIEVRNPSTVFRRIVEVSGLQELLQLAP